LRLDRKPGNLQELSQNQTVSLDAGGAIFHIKAELRS
jgi:hypothetical protein